MTTSEHRLFCGSLLQTAPYRNPSLDFRYTELTDWSVYLKSPVFFYASFSVPQFQPVRWFFNSDSTFRPAVTGWITSRGTSQTDRLLSYCPLSPAHWSCFPLRPLLSFRLIMLKGKPVFYLLETLLFQDAPLMSPPCWGGPASDFRAITSSPLVSFVCLS